MRIQIATSLGVAIGLTVVVATLSITGVNHSQNSASTVASWAATIVAGLGALLAVVQRSRVVLRSDGIDVTRNLWPTRRLARADIVGRRVHSGPKSGSYNVLIMRNGDQIALPPYLEHSVALRAWLEEVPLSSRKR
jgi:hypothetical protein